MELINRYAAREINAISVIDSINRKSIIDDTISFLDCLLRVTSLAPITSSPKIESIAKKDINATAKLNWPNPWGKRILARYMVVTRPIILLRISANDRIERFLITVLIVQH